MGNKIKCNIVYDDSFFVKMLVDRYIEYLETKDK